MITCFFQYVDTQLIEEEIIPERPKKVIKEKKIIGSKIDSWNRGYQPGGGNLKIYNKGLKFEGEEEPTIETYDRTYTKHQGVVQIRRDTDTPEADETTIEVITRPFEIEQTSQTVSVTREMKKLPTPPPPTPPVQIIDEIIEPPPPSVSSQRFLQASI